MGQAYPFFRDRFAERGITTGYAGGPGTGPLNPQGDGDWLSQIDRWVADFDPDVVNMNSLVVVGSSTTRYLPAGEGRTVMVTPRDYHWMKP